MWRQDFQDGNKVHFGFMCEKSEVVTYKWERSNRKLITTKVPWIL